MTQEVNEKIWVWNNKRDTGNDKDAEQRGNKSEKQDDRNKALGKCESGSQHLLLVVKKKVS